MRAGMQLGKTDVVSLVEPMRGNARLRHTLHFIGTDLELDWRAVRSDQRGVKRLVAVDLGYGDVVLESARHWLERGVQRSQREITLRHGIDDDPHAVDVEHFGEGQPLFAHLGVDGVKRFFAPMHLSGGDAVFGQGLVDGFENAAQDFPAVAPRRLHGLAQCAVTHRMQ